MAAWQLLSGYDHITNRNPRTGLSEKEFEVWLNCFYEDQRVAREPHWDSVLQIMSLHAKADH